MRNILLIAQGSTAISVVDRVMRDEHVLITRVSTAEEANALLSHSPVDAVICAVDELNAAGRACLEFVDYLDEVPTVVVLGNPLLPIRSMRINLRIVAIQHGVDYVRTAIRQQLRRVSETARHLSRPAEVEFSFVIPARPDRIGRARTIAGGFVQRSLKLQEYELLKLELVIEEALTNAVYHGSLEITSEDRANPLLASQLIEQRTSSTPYCDRKIRIDLALNDAELQIVVADEGAGFDVNAVTSSGNDISRSSGRGLLLMHAFADSLTFNETGNEVRITKLRSSFASQKEVSTPVQATRRVNTVSVGTIR